MTYLIQPSRFAVVGGGGGTTLTKSIDFDPADYLSMSHTDWGSYNRAKFAIACSFKLDTRDGSEDAIICKGPSFSGMEFDLVLSPTMYFRGSVSSFGDALRNCTDVTISTGSWYAVLAHFDSANSTSADKMKVWVNNVAQTSGSYTAPTGAVRNGGGDCYWGKSRFGQVDGRVFSGAFFSGLLPTPSEVFDGSSGKLKDLKGLAGLYSLLDVAGGSVISDYVKTPDWTNSGTISSTSVP